MKLRISPVLGIALIGFASGVPPASAQIGVTERASVDSNGVEGNNSSEYASVSADGRFVAFMSLATNLVPDDTNDAADVFVRDRRTGITERVSVDSRGRQGDAHSGLAGVGSSSPISADGRFVAFASFATNLVQGDTNGPVIADIFVRDRLLGTTERVSVSSNGAEADADCNFPTMSPDGRFVAFDSRTSTFFADDDVFTSDIFVHDRFTGITERVSVSTAGERGDSDSFFPDVSADGRFVVFGSWARNLVPGEQFFFNVFIHDRATGVTERVSEDAAGSEGNGNSSLAAVSGDGRFVAFETKAANLVAGSTFESKVLVRDRLTGAIENASVNAAGTEANALSQSPDITPDGRFVTFYSLADDIAPGDTNQRRDVFVRDRLNATTERVSVSTAGEQGNSESHEPKLSDDGKVIVFHSSSDNLVPDDTAPGHDVFVHDRRPPADLALAMTDDPDPAASRSALTYTVTAVNGGPGVATGVVLTDALPAEAVFLSASATQGSCVRSGGKGRRGGTLTCDLGALASGAAAGVTIQVETGRAGALTNAASVEANEPDPDAANNSASETTTVF